jgi:hypothetical protein
VSAVNNVLRGIIFLFFLFLAFVSIVAAGGQTDDSGDTGNTLEVLVGGFSGVCCAIIAGAALIGITPPARSTQVTYGGRGAVAPGPAGPVPPQPYGQPGQQYGAYPPQPPGQP